jgi:hypothetical protein
VLTTNVVTYGSSSSTFIKTGGTDNTWGDAQVYSVEGYARGAYCSAQPTSTAQYVMFGLNTDPAADASYTSIDFAWYFDFTNGIRIYEDSNDRGSFGTYTTATVLSITYDGATVRYFKDGSLLRSVTRAIGSPLYFDSSFYRNNSQGITNVTFGPMGEIGGTGGTGGTGGVGSSGSTGATGSTGSTGSRGSVGSNGSSGSSGSSGASDARFKTNIQPLQDTLSKVLQMRGVKYNWNELINNYSKEFSLDTECIGFIAQELELIFPEFVNKWRMSDEIPDARNVDYAKVVAVLVEAIKEQQSQITKLNERVTALENKK